MAECSLEDNRQQAGERGHCVVRVSGQGACLVAQQCRIRGTEASGSGLSVEDRASARLMECRAEGLGGVGWEVRAGARLAAEHCSVTVSRLSCAEVREGGAVELQHCTLCGFREGGGIVASGRGCRVEAANCSISSHQGSNVVVADGAQGQLVRCQCLSSQGVGGPCWEQAASSQHLRAQLKTAVAQIPGHELAQLSSSASVPSAPRGVQHALKLPSKAHESQQLPAPSP